ncbi:MAG: AAA family ATPase [Gammaproteobacteria bacterium]|nr:AAA family ATPase [Gammaproteobacteria bacterium]
MKIRLYNELNSDKIPGFAKFQSAIENNNFTQADVKKIADNLYRARLNRNDRLLFSLYSYNGQSYCLVLEYLPNHAYDKSRFLKRGAVIDETQIVSLNGIEEVEPQPLTYMNPSSNRFHLLNKILSFDNEQEAIYELPPPLVVIGSAGSGKTALTLEKMKHAVGDILFVSLSNFLVQSARNLYYAHDYTNDNQTIDFLSFHEFLESIKVPAGREITPKEFEGWFQRHKAATRLKDSHKLFEEFRGVLTGPSTQTAWLDREEYLALGIKQSIYAMEERSQVYDLFERYLQYLSQANRFDPNILSHDYLGEVSPRYDFVVIDEVQDMTNIQLYLILKTLRVAGQFLLCGDANQIVHPNFFSWSKVKTLFFENRSLTDQSEAIQILHANYRNSPVITEVANRVLKLKHARFGSIDKESNYLVTSMGEQKGTLQLLQDSEFIRRDLDSKTARSTQFAVLVMHSDQKAEARRWFNTPLVFSIQEAKGLEYENIILFNFISDEAKIFRDIAAGVDAKMLEQDILVYGRAKNKQDKSLEMYKFFINALYVAITRAVCNLYVVESQPQHAVIELLGLARFDGELTLKQQDSSLDEWQKEARKLELQGKEEQAEEIRQRILQEKTVPWPVLDREAFTALKEKALAGNNKKDRLKALEYAVLYSHLPTLNELMKAGFKPAEQQEKCLKQLFRKHFMAYDLKNPNAVLRDTEKYGVDHRTIFNLTPLMVATRLGNLTLVEALIERGASLSLTGSNGINAAQMSLELALTDTKYAKNKAGQIYPLLALKSLAIQVEGRLVKLDGQFMGLFILNLMFSLFYCHLGNVVVRGSAYTAKDIAEKVQQLPASILPQRRKRLAYISSILSGNEVSRDCKYNRKLFLRLRRGHYIINPKLKLRLDGEWVAIHKLLRLEDMGFVPAKSAISQRKLVEQRRSFQSGLGYTEQLNRISGSRLEKFHREVGEFADEAMEGSRMLA